MGRIASCASCALTAEPPASFLPFDFSFNPDHVVYYEDLDMTNSRIKLNRYVYPVEQVFNNLDLVKEYLENWKYND